MTEPEWNASIDPTLMLASLRAAGKLTERKARLFAAACSRRVWDFFRDDRPRRAVDIAEQFADGLVGHGEFDRWACFQCWEESVPWSEWAEDTGHERSESAARENVGDVEFALASRVADSSTVDAEGVARQ